MSAEKVKKFLDEKNIKYISITHSPVYTALEIAESVHIPGKEMVKSVIVKLEDRVVMVVLPSTSHVDLEIVRVAMDARKAELANEYTFRSLFPDCEIGAMPPFGNLYNIDMIVSDRLEEDAEIAFNAGTHREVIKMKYNDYKEIVKPKLMKLTD